MAPTSLSDWPWLFWLDELCSNPLLLQLVPYLTALENVMLAQYFHSLPDENEAVLRWRRLA